MKFRAWDEDAKRMIPMDGGSFDEHSGSLRFYLQSVPTRNSIPRFMFSMDITDKKGNDVFEGDIVTYGVGKYKSNYMVVFSKHYGCFGLTRKNSEEDGHRYLLGHGGSSTRYSPYLWNWLSKKIEVIGNIFENYDLMEKTQ